MVLTTKRMRGRLVGTSPEHIHEQHIKIVKDFSFLMASKCRLGAPAFCVLTDILSAFFMKEISIKAWAETVKHFNIS